MKVAGYARVSSREQVEGYSLDAQIRAIEAYCAARGWEPPTMYVDEGRSAYTDVTAQRPRFSAMLDAAEGQQYGAIVVHKLDRFARSLLVTLRELQRLEKSGVAFASISEDMNFTTPIGRVILATLAAFAEYYSRNLSNEVNKGIVEKRRQGLHVGGVPWAARRVDGLLQLRADRADTLRLIFALAARHGLHTTAVLLNERGIPAPRGGMWSTQTVAYLTGPGAEWLRALGDEWDEPIRAARANRRTPAIGPGRATRLLSGLLHCACGGRLHYSTPWTRPDGSVVHSLHCRNKDRPTIVACGRLRTHAERYEYHIAAWFLSLPDLARGAEVADDSGPRRAALRERRRRLDRLYFDLSTLSDHDYDAQAAVLAAEERALPPPPLSLRAVAQGVRQAQEEWDWWPAPARNRFLRGILSGVLVNGRTVLPVPNGALATLLRASEAS